MALNRRDAESDPDIAFVLHEHAGEPLDREIERIESLLASCLWRHQQEEVVEAVRLPLEGSSRQLKKNGLRSSTS
jgi:hypothetical protein